MIVFSDEQIEILKELNIEVTGSYKEDELLEIEEKISGYLTYAGITNNEVNTIGLLCESILDMVIDENGK